MKYFILILLSLVLHLKTLPQTVNFNISEKNEIIIDFNSEFYDFYIKNLDKVSSAEKISIKNISDTVSKIPKLYEINKVKTLEFSNIDPKNLYAIIYRVPNKTSINNLIFNEIKSYNPKKTINLKTNKIEFNYCTTEALKSILKSIENKDEIKSIIINNSNLIEIPEEVYEFKNLRELDLSSNFLQDISQQYDNLSNIEILKISGNNIPNLNEILLKQELSSLIYLEIDSIDNENLTEIEEKFPNLKIKQISYSSEKSESTVLYGDLKTSFGKTKALSIAYLHYPEVMNNLMASTSIDSTQFEERFYNIDYRGLYSKYDTSLSQKNQIYIHNKIIDDKFSFNFHNKKPWYYKRKRIDYSFYKTHPEFGIFRQSTWVMDTVLSRKEAKEFVEKTQFNDVRLFYNSSENNFTLVLKSADRFYKFKVYPISKKSSKNIEEQKKNYAIQYASYLKRLSSRGRSFNQGISRSKSRLQSARKLFQESLWSSFSSNYMSETEKKMSKTEWLKYYYDIVENEQAALFEADLKNDLFIRNLRLKGYIESDLFNSEFAIYNTYYIQLTDKMNNNIPVNSLMVINRSDLTFQTIQHSNPLNEIPIITKAGDSYVIIAFLLNNSVATVKSATLNNRLISDGISRVESFIFPQELCTNGQIINDLEL